MEDEDFMARYKALIGAFAAQVRKLIDKYRRNGNCAAARADLCHDVRRRRGDGTDDRIDDTRVGEEVLPEAFAWPLRAHCAASPAARRTASTRLPLSALPVPAMSRAVP